MYVCTETLFKKNPHKKLDNGKIMQSHYFSEWKISYIKSSKWANGDAKTLENRPIRIHIAIANICNEMNHVRSSNFACRTLRWWVYKSGIKRHMRSDSNRPHNDTVRNAIMARLPSAQRNKAIERLQQGQLNKLLQGNLVSPDRPSPYGLGTV